MPGTKHSGNKYLWVVKDNNQKGKDYDCRLGKNLGNLLVQPLRFKSISMCSS